MTFLQQRSKVARISRPGVSVESRLAALARGTEGESLVETLVSVLIGGLALLMLAVVVAASSNMVLGNQDNMEQYYKQASAFAGAGGKSVSGTASLQTADGSAAQITSDSSSGTADVEYNVGEVAGEAVISYQKAGDGS